MITVRLVGGLGNQMNQYALGRALSLERNDDLFLDTDPLYYDIREYELSVFNIHATIATSKQRPRYLKLRKNKFLDKIQYIIAFIGKKLNLYHIIENPRHPIVHNGMFDYNPKVKQKVLKTKNNVYLEGFRHSEKYFKKYANTIRKDFTLKQEINDPKNKDILEKMKASTSISIHVRRTDYITLAHQGYKLCDLSYYKSAIQHIKKKIKNPIFFIFSDDIHWCKENFKEHQFEYFINWNSGKNSYKDMMLMAQCKHNIIANSTFSRRGARLNSNPEKIVIAPKQWHQYINYSDIIPEERIRL